MRWIDVDFQGKTVSVKQSLSKGKNGRPFFKKPKTRRGERVLLVSEDVLKRLRIHRAQQEAERGWAGELWQESGLIFTTEIGTLIHPDNVKRVVARVCEEAGIKPINLHGMRHTYTSLAFKKGLDEKLISERLGHEDVAFTRKTYQHIYRSQHEAGALSMDELLDLADDAEEKMSNGCQDDEMDS